MTIKLTAGILALGLAAGTAWAQNPNLIQSTHDTMKALQNKQQVASDAALGNTAKAPAQPSATPAAYSGAVAAPKNSPAAPSGQKATSSTKTSSHTTKFKVVARKKTAKGKPSVAVDNGNDAASGTTAKKTITATGRRDPFISPVVNQSMAGSGCSVGKRCLAIDQIALKGVVRSDNGMIAVVVNSLDKAYFLRENDPVFNGYVVRITGDSIIFKETVQDRLGKQFTRQVTKKITTPAV
jgi:hypothetical protein